MAAWLAAATAWAGGWKAGDALPDLGGFGLDGKRPELAGKVVIIDFWASWCDPCRAAFPVLDGLHAELAKRGLVVIGVNVDEDAAAMERFLKARPVSFAIVRDARQRLVEAAAPPSLPMSIVVDRRGVIRFTHAGFRAKETPAEWRREVTALLAEAGP
jgi:thiol-disulfide isomerase/thioredoxin